VVSAVVEQVYSSTFKFRLLKIQEICPPKCFIITSKCTKMRLMAGLRPDPLGLGELRARAAPQAPSWIKGRGTGGREGEEGRGALQCLKQVDANGSRR